MVRIVVDFDDGVVVVLVEEMMGGDLVLERFGSKSQVLMGWYPSQVMREVVQRTQQGFASSHFRRRRLQVIQPVRTLGVRFRSPVIVAWSKS